MRNAAAEAGLPTKSTGLRKRVTGLSLRLHLSAPFCRGIQKCHGREQPFITSAEIVGGGNWVGGRDRQAIVQPSLAGREDF